MIKDMELEIMASLEQEKKLSEIFLGKKCFNWYFSKATYTAKCTEAVEFTLFDKTICGILSVEPNLSLEQIGEILGFNVIHKPEEKKYKDHAEYEILKEALQSLETYQMITVGDIYYSYCKLTAIGREYVQKGKKFKIHEDKEFSLFFDHTGNNHDKARKNFEFSRGDFFSKDPGAGKINYEDEEVLKAFAGHQIPEIYDPVRMNSFVNPELKMRKSFKIMLYAVFLVDLKSEKHRCLVYDTTTKKINEYYSNYLAENVAMQSTFFREVLDEEQIYANPLFEDFDYKQILIEAQQEIEDIDLENDNKIESLKKIILATEFTDPNFFFNHLKDFVYTAKKEVWIIIDMPSNDVVKAIRSVLTELNDKNLFLFLPVAEDLNEAYRGLEEDLKNRKNCYLLFMEKVEEFNIVIDQEKAWTIYKKKQIPLKTTVDGGLTIEKELIQRYSDKEIDSTIMEFKRLFADKYLQGSLNDMKSLLESYDLALTSLADIKKVELIDETLIPFRGLTEYEPDFKDIENRKSELIKTLKTRRRKEINQKLDPLKAQIASIAPSNDKAFKEIKDFIKNEKKDLFPEEQILFDPVDALLKELKKFMDQYKLRKSFIIDTNAFLDEPFIIENIGEDHIVVVSAKVLEELDYRSKQSSTRDQARKAIRQVKKHSNKKNIKFAKSNVDNLTVDFNRPTGDNLILSVAIDFKNEGAVLITNDINLQLKANTQEISAISTDELKKLLSKKLKTSKPSR